MKIDVLTLFPEMFPGVFGASMLGRAQEKGILDFRLHIKNTLDTAHGCHTLGKHVNTVTHGNHWPYQASYVLIECHKLTRSDFSPGYQIAAIQQGNYAGKTNERFQQWPNYGI